jgi:hypothetical protein
VGITGQDISEFLDAQSGFNICLFQSYPMEVSIYGGLFTVSVVRAQGGASETLRRVWQNVLGQKLPLVYCPEGCMLVGHCNCFITNKKNLGRVFCFYNIFL